MSVTWLAFAKLQVSTAVRLNSSTLGGKHTQTSRTMTRVETTNTSCGYVEEQCSDTVNELSTDGQTVQSSCFTSAKQCFIFFYFLIPKTNTYETLLFKNVNRTTPSSFSILTHSPAVI